MRAAHSRKELIDYLFRGFTIINSNLYIFFVRLAFVFVILLLSVARKPFDPLSAVEAIISFIISYFGICYYLSIPLFFQSPHLGKNVQMSLHIVWESARRIFVPLLIIIPFFLLASFILATLFLSRNQNFSFASTQYQFFINIYDIVYNVIYAALIFIPMYFTLKRNGLFLSIKKSALFAKDHMSYVLLVTIILSAETIFNNLSGIIYRGFIMNVLLSVVDSYVTLGILASAYLYWKENSNLN